MADDMDLEAVFGGGGAKMSATEEEDDADSYDEEFSAHARDALGGDASAAQIAALKAAIMSCMGE